MLLARVESEEEEETEEEDDAEEEKEEKVEEEEDDDEEMSDSAWSKSICSSSSFCLFWFERGLHEAFPPPVFPSGLSTQGDSTPVPG